MEVYKIGSEYYNGISDCNGGTHEFELIEKALHWIDSDKFVVLVNGNTNNQDEVLEKFKDKKKIFVATDWFAFNKNKKIIDNCDYLLHQSLNGYVEGTKVKNQAFSGVPFLFCNSDSTLIEPENESKISLIIFGGANTGRQAEFEKYLEHDTEKLFLSFVKKYDLNGNVIFDNRLGYNSFQVLMSLCKYSLMITRSEYAKSRWFTPRIVESINNGCLPIIDVNYPVFFSWKKVECYRDVVDTYTYYEYNEGGRLETIEALRQMFEERKNDFRHLIENIVNC